MSEKCGSAWTEVVALAVAQDITIYGGHSRIMSQAFASSTQASDLVGGTAPLPGLPTRVGVATSPSRGVSFTNSLRIVKKTARTRENPSLHYTEGLKEVSMATPRYFAVSTIVTGVPSPELIVVSGG